MSTRQRPVVARSFRQLGQPEVGNLHSAFCIEHDVFWLDVTMHHAFAMSILQCVAHLLNHTQRHLGGHLSGLHELPQIGAVDVFHDEVKQRPANRLTRIRRRRSERSISPKS